MNKILYLLLVGLLFSKVNFIQKDCCHQTDDSIFFSENKNTTKTKNNLISSSTVYLDNSASYYYSNLTTNFPNNMKGTCTYVAMAMLLQYYDTFWDDNIIPEAYDVPSVSTSSINERTSSPGVRKDTISDYENGLISYSDLTNDVYFDYVMDMADEYFQPLLFWIANYELDILSSVTDDCFASLGTAARVKLMNYYLQNYVGYSEDDYTITTYNEDGVCSKSDEVRAYIIDKVLQGIPVLAVLCRDTLLHACIIYDYDEENNWLYLHYGSGENSTHILAECAATVYFMSATTLELNVDHNHSNNYVLEDEDGNLSYYCGCKLYTHEHEYTYTKYNSSSHKISCYCDYEGVAAHSFSYTSLVYSCIYCGYIKTSNSTITPTPISLVSGDKEEEIN